MDFTAISLAKENNLTLKVVDLMWEWALQRAIIGDNEWTTIHS
jgi:uridylate kinase